MTRRALLLAIGLTILSAVSATVYHVQAVEHANRLIDPTNPAGSPLEMVQKVNALRQSRGLAPLSINQALSGAAQEQADYISNTGIYAHVRNGSSPESRALAAGYVTTEWCCSENTHRTRVGLSAWEFWNYSLSHYHNMINPKWTEIGVATSQIGVWTGWVLVFGSGVQGDVPPPAAPSSPANPAPAQPNSAPPPAAPSSPAPVPLSGDTYRVVWGDSLSKIAAQHNTTTGALRQVNNISGDLIFAGQTLVLPGGSPAPAAPAQPADPPAEAVPPSEPPAAAGNETYRVISGDTLLKIAQRYGTSVNAIMAVNGLTDRNLIISGQQLIIPTE